MGLQRVGRDGVTFTFTFTFSLEWGLRIRWHWCHWLENYLWEPCHTGTSKSRVSKNSRGESDTESGAKTVAKTKGKGLTQLGEQPLWAAVGSIVWFYCRANFCFIPLILLLSRDSTWGIRSKAGPLSALWSWTSCLPLLFLCFPISKAEL